MATDRVIWSRDSRGCRARGGGAGRSSAEGRTAAVETSLIEASAHRFAGGLRYLAMDLSGAYRSGAPDGVILVADPFHLVKIANRKIDAAFRRLTYRTEHPYAELGLPRPLHHMLRRNIETLAPGHIDIIAGALDTDADGQQIEHLRDLLALRITKTHVSPAPSDVRGKLASF